MKLKIVMVYCLFFYFSLNATFTFSQINKDTIRYEGLIAYENCSQESMLNYYLVDDGIYSDKGFYILLDSIVQYSEGFLCLSTLNILDTNKIGEGLPYLYKFYDFLENKNKEQYISYTNAKNYKKLLRKMNSKKIQNYNYPVLSAFDQNKITVDRLKTCYSVFKAKITAISKPEYNFERYIFDGKKLKLKEIKFYYISELEIEGHKIRVGRDVLN